MKLKPRHLFAALMLIAEAPILAPMVVGCLITGAACATAVGIQQARLWLRDASARMRQSATRRPPHPSRAVSGW